MRKKWISIVSGLLLMLTAGCSFRTPEDMYTLPQPPAEYQNLNTCIQETMTSLGAEYAAPLAGNNSQTVQLVDLDKDGVDEAVAFFRVTGDAKPLKVYIFKKDQNDNYYIQGVIEGEGTAIYSIAYEDLGGTPSAEIIVSWRMSEKVHALAAYSVDTGSQGTVTELMRTGYSQYRVMDIDMDNQMEILVLQLDTTEDKSRVELYDHQDGMMVLCATAPMSSGIKEISAVRTGLLRGSVQALFVSSSFGESNGVLTDIFAWRDKAFVNITMDEENGQSLSTVRYYDLVSGTDINGDNVLEIPMPEALPADQKNSTVTVSDFWTVHWQQYDVEGTAWSVGSTYHNVQDRWYLWLPESWEGQLTLSRRDNAVYGERAVVFSRWRGEVEGSSSFLIIYRLTGDNREIRFRIGNRFVLKVQSDTVYAAEFLDNGWDSGLDQEELIERFYLIETDWSDVG